jgi:hypothetical protein
MPFTARDVAEASMCNLAGGAVTQKGRKPESLDAVKAAVIPSRQTPVPSSQHSLILPEPTPYSLYPNDGSH